MGTTAADLENATSRPPRRLRKPSQFKGRDRTVFLLMVGIPTLLHVLLVWIPTISSIILSFTDWNGIRFSEMSFVGFLNYEQIFTVFEKDFFQAVFNNFVLLVFLFIGPTIFGMGLAYLLDKNIRGSRVYQSAFYTPVVLSLAVVGFMWQSVIYSTENGLATALDYGYWRLDPALPTYLRGRLDGATLAAATAGLFWAASEWLLKGKPSVLGLCSGVVAGLVVITPACGFVTSTSAVIMGAIAGIVPFLAVEFLKRKLGYDDALDTFGIHGVGGTLGAVLTGVFADEKVNPVVAGLKDGLLAAQFKACALTIVWSLAATLVITLIVTVPILPSWLVMSTE